MNSRTFYSMWQRHLSIIIYINTAKLGDTISSPFVSLSHVTSDE